MPRKLPDVASQSIAVLIKSNVATTASVDAAATLNDVYTLDAWVEPCPAGHRARSLQSRGVRTHPLADSDPQRCDDLQVDGLCAAGRFAARNDYSSIFYVVPANPLVNVPPRNTPPDYPRNREYLRTGTIPYTWSCPTRGMA